MDTVLISLPAAAERLGVSERWLRDAVRRRQVPHRRVGKSPRFTEADLDAIPELFVVLPAAAPESSLAPSIRRRRSA